VRRFDASIGGLGGCPFAPGAAGNLATEDLALMAQQCGLETGIDLDALCRAIDTASRIVGYQVGGHSRAWLARGGRVQDGLR
jgi:hydroxymethylglutaryl-CoA lyase